jgi:alcohol dehydrogenase (cytochrome c)
VTTIKNTDVAPTDEGVMVCPGMGGGTKWNGPSFDPARKTLFVAATDWCSLLKKDQPVYVAGKPYWGGKFEFDKAPGAAKGWISAVDSDTGKIRWQYHVGTLMSAGVTSTASGLLFTGDTKGNFRVFDSSTGAVLREIPINASLAGGMITYAVNGRQFVAFTAGNISRSTYELAGTPTVVIMGLTDGVQSASLPSQPVQQAATRPGDAGRGKTLYLESCVSCHGEDGTAIPTHSLLGRKHLKTTKQIVQRIKTPKAPMPALFPSPYGEQDIQDIAAYVHSRDFQTSHAQ